MTVHTLEIQKLTDIIRRDFVAQHLVLIDGNPKQRCLFAELLNIKLRFRVTELATGNAASAFIEANATDIDLILLDLSTVSDGFEALANLRGCLPDIPVIVFVQYGDYQCAAEALLLGAQDFLTKPVAEERMHVTLRNTIQLRNAKKEAHRALAFQGRTDRPALASGGNTETLISLINTNGDARKIEEIEMAAIQFAIRFYNGRMTEVARKLGIGRSTLYRKLESVIEPIISA